MTARKKKRRPIREYGWREMVGLPDLAIPCLRAKIDTGARTSALHATRQRLLRIDDEDWVEFHVPVPGTDRSTRCKARLVDRRQIKNTSGIAEERFVIRTMLIIAKRKWPIELSLANRDNMGFDLILGRTAVRRRNILINPGRSYLAGPPANKNSNAAKNSVSESAKRTSRSKEEKRREHRHART
ncbi:MAG: RimK/LysX family protein [Gammaproteobacteria bacterium]|nr:RimK/LysX family protein [Gammaproteobacteria bacterium]